MLTFYLDMWEAEGGGGAVRGYIMQLWASGCKSHLAAVQLGVALVVVVVLTVGRWIWGGLCVEPGRHVPLACPERSSVTLFWQSRTAPRTPSRDQSLARRRSDTSQFGFGKTPSVTRRFTGESSLFFFFFFFFFFWERGKPQADCTTAVFSKPDERPWWNFFKITYHNMCTLTASPHFFVFQGEYRWGGDGGRGDRGKARQGKTLDASSAHALYLSVHLVLFSEAGNEYYTPLLTSLIS